MPIAVGISGMAGSGAALPLGGARGAAETSEAALVGAFAVAVMACGVAGDVPTVRAGCGAAMLAAAGVAGWRVTTGDKEAAMWAAGLGLAVCACRVSCRPMGCGSGVAIGPAIGVSLGDTAATGAGTKSVDVGGSRVATGNTGSWGDDVPAG